jgi:hypothetical protein
MHGDVKVMREGVRGIGRAIGVAVVGDSERGNTKRRGEGGRGD